MKKIKSIIWEGKVLAHIIKAGDFPDKTSFFSEESDNLQVGCIVYPDNTQIPKHLHKPVIRNLDRTEEVLVVREGEAILDLYNQNKDKISSVKVTSGDVIILTGGGHGLRVIKKTKLLEIKQGPYFGVDEKERF